MNRVSKYVVLLIFLLSEVLLGAWWSLNTTDELSSAFGPRNKGDIEYDLLEVDLFQNKSELVAKTTAWEYYFNRLRPNSYHQHQSPYTRMKREGISSKTAEQACLWTVTVLDDPKLKNIHFNLPQSACPQQAGKPCL